MADLDAGYGFFCVVKVSEELRSSSRHSSRSPSRLDFSDRELIMRLVFQSGVQRRCMVETLRKIAIERGLEVPSRS